MPARSELPLRRFVAGLLLAATAVVATATPALAHTSLKSSTPAKGAVLSTAPTRVSLTFGEAVTLPADPIKIVGADGTAWTVGTAAVTDATVTAPVTPAGPAGAYTLTWTVISDDGDAIRGTVPFTLTAAPGATTTTTAAPATTVTPVTTTPAAPAPVASQTATPTGGGMPGWAWIVLAVVVVGAATGVARLRSRRSGA